MGVTISITFTKDLLTPMVEELQMLDGMVSDTGFLDDVVHELRGDLNVPTVALIQEYGYHATGDTGRETSSPPRPFMSTSFTIWCKSHLRAHAKALINPAKRGGRQGEVLRAGRQMKEEMRLSIEAWFYPRNAERTIEEKGFNDPLVWTGQMLEAVTSSFRRVSAGRKLQKYIRNRANWNRNDELFKGVMTLIRTSNRAGTNPPRVASWSDDGMDW